MSHGYSYSVPLETEGRPDRTGMAAESRPAISHVPCPPAEARKILMVSGDFVPVSSNNTFRALGFVDELPPTGWRPYVLTRKPELSTWEKDGHLTADCPVIEIEGSRRLWSLIKAMRSLVPEFLLADKGRSVIPFSVVKGVRLVLKEKIDIVFGSFHPWSSLVTAYLISRISGRPLVAEFRDPILSMVGESRLRLARRIIRHADAIVATTREIAEDISAFTEDTARRPPLVLPHAYRQVDRNGYGLDGLDERFIVTFTGTLYAHGCIDTLCSAFAAFLAARPDAARIARLRFVGRDKDGAFDMVRTGAQAHGFSDRLEFISWASQEDLRRLVRESAIVWCMDVGRPTIIPGKLAKLFAGGRPMFAFCVPGGATSRALDETRAGAQFTADDADGLAAHFGHIYAARRGEAQLAQRNESVIDGYSFRAIASTLSRVLAEIATAPAPGKRRSGKRIERRDGR